MKQKVVANLTNNLRGVLCMMYVYCVCHSTIWVGVGKENGDGGQLSVGRGWAGRNRRREERGRTGYQIA